MSDNRFVHAKMGHSEKIEALSDFQFRVWITYLIAADDCGIVRKSVTSFRDANVYLDHKPAGEIEAAMQHLVTVGLLYTYVNQKRTFLFQLDWQDWQNLRHPRVSIHPEPTAQAFAKCSEAQQALLIARYRKTKDEFLNESAISETFLQTAKSFGNISPNGETFPQKLPPARALTANSKQQTANSKEQEPETVEFRRTYPVRRTDGVFAGSLPRDTIDHVFTSDTSSVHVPSAVHYKLVNALAPKYGGDRQKAADVLKAWYPTIAAAVAPDYVMGDAFKFWQPPFDRDHASEVKAGPKVPTHDELLAEVQKQEALRERKPKNARQ